MRNETARVGGCPRVRQITGGHLQEKKHQAKMVRNRARQLTLYRGT